MKTGNVLLVLLLCGMCACGGRGTRNTGSENSASSVSEDTLKMPLRKAYEGFEWKELHGAGIRLMVQSSENIRLLVDPLLPGVVMVRDGDAAPSPLLRVFNLKNGNIEDVLAELKKQDGWDNSCTCVFRKEEKSSRSGVNRYVLVPDGDYAGKMDSLLQNEPVPSTCCGWGIGNSGYRYFEIQDAAPDKALFVEIGQDAPLFDENSIILENTVDKSDIDGSGFSRDILYTMDGVVRIGHEVRSFVPDGSETEYWIVDKTGRLESYYDKATGGQKNGKPLKVRLALEYNGKWDDGFAAEYAGTFLVRAVTGIME